MTCSLHLGVLTPLETSVLTQVTERYKILSKSLMSKMTVKKNHDKVTGRYSCWLIGSDYDAFIAIVSAYEHSLFKRLKEENNNRFNNTKF